MTHDYDDPAHDADMAELRREQLAADVGDDVSRHPLDDMEDDDFEDYFEEEDFVEDDDFEEDDFEEENEWPVNRSYDRV